MHGELCFMRYRIDGEGEGERKEKGELQRNEMIARMQATMAGADG